MAVNMHIVLILSFCLFFYIRGLDVCEDKSYDCQPCNLQYPVPSPTRENCMKTCQVCTNDKNVALNQTTKQSSTAHKGESERAVDGDTNGDYGHGSCTHTDQNSGTQWWCVDLKKIFNIKNLKMYNRDGSNGYRLQGFELKTTSSGQCNKAGFTTSSLCYKNDPPTNHRVYTIDRCNQDSNKSIVAGTLFVSVTGVSLTICEVQVFTGIGCSYGYYSTSGSTCEPCNDGCSDNKCNPDTGDCIGVCKSGFYGSKCNKACSQGCSTPDCKRDGSCTVCKPGWYGDNCESRCPTGCKETCNITSGTCDECKEGTVGLYCDVKCGEECRTMTEEERRWSICKEQNCMKNCTEICYGSSCDVKVERCEYFCIGGQRNRQCFNFEVSDKHIINGAAGVGIGITVGLIVGVVAGVLIFWFCFVRKRRVTSQPGDLGTRSEPNESRLDEIPTANISTSQSSVMYENKAEYSNPYDTLEQYT